MSGSYHGMDPGAARDLAARLDRCADDVEGLGAEVTATLAAVGLTSGVSRELTAMAEDDRLAATVIRGAAGQLEGHVLTVGGACVPVTALEGELLASLRGRTQALAEAAAGQPTSAVSQAVYEAVLGVGAAGTARVQNGGAAGTDDDDSWVEWLRESSVAALLAEFTNYLHGWTGDEQRFPAGAVPMAMLRARRTGAWLSWATLPGADVHIPTGLPAVERFPTWNTGMLGRASSFVMDRAGPVGQRGAAWLRSPAATNVFRYGSVAGSVLSTGLGAASLIEQGNPLDAFEREGAGYLADVAGTTYSAASAVFFATAATTAPISAPIMVAAGLTWAGLEIYDHRHEIAAAATEAWNTAGEWLDATADAFGRGLDTAGDAIGNGLAATSEAIVDGLQATGDALGDGLDAAGDLVGDGLDAAGDLAGAAADALTFWD